MNPDYQVNERGSTLNNYISPVMRKRLLYGLIAVLFFIAAVYFIIDYRKARLTIVTEDGATILATTDANEELREVGVGKATIKTNSLERIYVLVEKDERVTQVVYQLSPSERREENIELRDLKTKTQLAEGALSHIFLTEEFAFGSDPLEQTLLYYPRRVGASPGVDYSRIPPVDDVAWQNSRNFVFDAFGDGAAFFVDGEYHYPDLGYETEDFIQLFQDFATVDPKERILLLNQEGLYYTDGITKDTPQLLRTLDSVSGDSELFTVRDTPLIVTQIFEDRIEEDAEPADPDNSRFVLEGEGVSEFAPVGYTVQQINFQGETIRSFDLDITDIIENIVPFGDGFAVLTSRDVIILNQDGSVNENLPLFFEQAEDILTYDGRIVLLNQAGAWEYNLESQTLSLLARYGDEEKYAPKSLTGSDGRIIYSVLQIEEEREFEPGEEVSFDFGGGDTAPGYIYSFTLD